MLKSLQIAEKTSTSGGPLAVLRWALVAIFVWFGCMKFTGYEAHGIEGFIAHSPITGRLNLSSGVQGAGEVIGVLLATAAALILGAFNAFFSALRATMSSATYPITLTFMFSTPGVTAAPPGGFPWISRRHREISNSRSRTPRCLCVPASEVNRGRAEYGLSSVRRSPGKRLVSSPMRDLGLCFLACVG
jgi:uncharacterized membrane protein YkgB